MPINRTKDGFETRIRYGKGKRQRFVIRTDIEAKAVERDRALRAMAARLAAAGHSDYAPLMLTKAAAATEAEFKKIERYSLQLCEGKLAVERPKLATTFKQLANRWTNGDLHKQWPENVRDINHDTNTTLLDKYVLPTLGELELAHVTREHCDEVMRKLPAKLARNSRRHVAKVVARVLNLAEFAGIINRSPLPRGWVPAAPPKKDTPVLYPAEDAKLLANTDVPLMYRVYYGFLHREGGRRSETAALQVHEIDVDHETVQLDENKTQHARWWKLSPGVADAIKAWLALREGDSEPDSLVFSDKDVPINTDHMARKIRAHLENSEVKRPRLFSKGTNTLRFGTHGFRHSFATRSLANGKTDDWVRQRTGHTTDELLTYRESAKSLQELHLGELTPLVDAIPELRAWASKQKGGPKGGPSLPAVENKTNTKAGRGERIRTSDPLTPSQVR